MKMGAGLFIGIFFILIGAGIVIKMVFNIDLPIFKVLIAFLFVWIGIKILIGDRWIQRTHTTGHDVVFGESTWNADNLTNKEYNVVFGKGTYDFRDVKLEGTEPRLIKINTVFGGSELKIRKDMPYRIETNGAFAGAELPNGNNAIFGSSKYESPNLRSDSAFLHIKADVVFGGIRVIEY